MIGISGRFGALLVVGGLLACGWAGAQELRAPATGLLTGYWEKGGLPGFIASTNLPAEHQARPLLGGLSYSLNDDDHFSIGLGWQPGRTADEAGRLGAAGASWRHQFDGLWAPVLTAGVSLLRPEGMQGIDGGPMPDTYGAHLSLGLNPARDWGVSLGIGYRAGADVLAYEGAGERSKSLYGDLAAIYRWHRNVDIQGELSGLDLRAPNRDNAFSREIGVRMRYSFE